LGQAGGADLPQQKKEKGKVKKKGTEEGSPARWRKKVAQPALYISN